MKNSLPIDRAQLGGLLAFVSVAEQLSFRRAGSELGISASAVSQAIRALEGHVGTPLLARTTRQVGLTEAGQRLLQRVRPALAELIDALQSEQASSERVTGVLRLSVPRAVLAPLVEPIVAQLIAAQPSLQVEVRASDDKVDLVRDGFDAGIRLAEQVSVDMTAVRITPPFPFAVVGSPEYLAQHGAPQHPRDLRSHRCVLFRTREGAIYRWEFVEAGVTFTLRPRGALTVDDSHFNVAAAARGLGLAYTALPLAAASLERGQLVRVLGDYLPQTPGMFVYFPSRAQVTPKLRAFIGCAKQVAAGLASTQALA